MAARDGASSISVTVRVRPFTIREAAQLAKCDESPLFLGDGSLASAPTPKLSQKGIRPVLKVLDEKCLIFDPPEENPIQRFSRSVVPQGKRVKDQTFAFDRVFDENTTQGDVYEATTKPLLDSVFEGYNATVFAYGATGCGKTHTITGTAQDPGIIFLTMQELFERIQEKSEEKTCEISLSYLEIYNETIRDLLVPGGSKQALMLREDANQTVSVAGLSSHHPQNVQEVMDMIVRGNEYRTMSPTEANATSSRSHAVLQINVSTKDRNADVNEPHTMATLSIIDLAGSERASVTKNRGERLLEGANINKSLLALGSCINALCDPRKRNHIPYRNSKLTRLLKFSLGGNCRTVMIVCVSPSSAHFDETQNTLRYANRAKNIQTKVTRNVFNVNRHVKDYLKKIDEQRQLIDELKAAQKDFEASSFVKFRKQSEKREGLAKEGIMRIRAAYEHSAPERNERLNMMKKLRQVERRISLISAWIAGFDTVCETREDEEPPVGLASMRKTALGIQAELEASRQHYHQRLAKNNWARALETALQTGLRQLKEADGATDGSDSASLMREAELLKSTADREAYHSVLDMDKGGDAAIVQVLLQAHFETVAILNQITQMNEEEAVQAARSLLGKIIQSCSDATGQVIKPDGGLPVTEVFAPTKAGTPKRRKPVNLMGPSPMKMPAAPVFKEAAAFSSPAKSSPRRRKLGGARKIVQFTPKKNGIKPAKRGVRWKDDTEDGELAEFQATPQPFEDAPTSSSIDLPAPTLSSNVNFHSDPENSSPIPPPPETSIDLKPAARSSRFQTGFLTKKSDGSPSGSLLSSHSYSQSHSSDSESGGGSPLREVPTNIAPQPSPLRSVESTIISDGTAASECAAQGSSSSDEDNGKPRHRTASGTSTGGGSLKLGRDDAKRIRSALKRNSTSSVGSSNTATRVHRRRSPTATSASPPGGETGGLFSVGQARRMGLKINGSGTGTGESSVLSPRTAPVVKPRRVTVETASTAGAAGAVRVRASMASATAPGGPKSVWR